MHAHIINAQKIASIFDVGLAHINNGHTKSLHMHTAIEDTIYTQVHTHACTHAQIHMHKQININKHTYSIAGYFP